MLAMRGELCPFKYAERFASLDAVARWAADNPTALFDNAAHVDGIIGQSTCGAATHALLAQTLHTWIADTWRTRQGATDRFPVWEGSRHFHPTVNVEFTQAPFYLAVWPELLEMELRARPAYTRDGRKTLGARGEGTLFFAHDCRRRCEADAPRYNHDMEVAETAIYIILAYAHWRRTGHNAVLRDFDDVLRRSLAFLAAADTTGNGIPDQGVCNTIDDASPAIQFGREQVYLAVKTLAALPFGVAILRHLGDAERADHYPRGLAIWGTFDTLAGLTIDRVTGLDRSTQPLPFVRVPRLIDADWVAGTCTVIGN